MTSTTPKYQNQKPLRAAAAQALRSRGYQVETITGSGGARLRITQGNSTQTVSVRTSSDRWVGWMRNDEEEWRGLDEADEVVVAALARPGFAEVFGFAPNVVRQAFDANLAAREAAANLKKTAPVFVCLDQAHDPNSPSATSDNLKTNARWRAEVPLNTSATQQEVVSILDAASRENATESFVARVRQDFARLVGVPFEKVSVEFRVLP